MAPPARYDEHRLLIRDGWRHYRPRYALAEVYAGLLLLVGLMAVAIWVLWKGAHPDSELLAVGAALLEGEPARPVAGARAAAPAAGASRGRLPQGLAAPGWREQRLAHYGVDNLYEKINGRADYFKSFGFRRLSWVALIADAPLVASVDLELYDLGSAANAIGAFAGERPAEASVRRIGPGLAYDAPNARFLTHGRYYLRALGSDASVAVGAALDHLAQRLRRALPGEPLPWAYALFVEALGLDLARLTYLRENAFSFGFAREVWTARLDAEAELFVARRADAAQARAFAAQLTAGFASYGTPRGQAEGVRWIADRYLNTLAGATSAGVWVLGVRGAADRAAALAALRRLRAALLALAQESIADG
ncbi:MAG: hypothetical protein IPL40_08955 [Proteobacteria bacterium]|nr:hypothetical protein [Pseudomonadota bacterium]